jgi:hypothetical protein
MPTYADSTLFKVLKGLLEVRDGGGVLRIGFGVVVGEPDSETPTVSKAFGQKNDYRNFLQRPILDNGVTDFGDQVMGRSRFAIVDEKDRGTVQFGQRGLEVCDIGLSIPSWNQLSTSRKIVGLYGSRNGHEVTHAS